MKEDYELLKKYLQNEIDTGNNKTFIFDKDDVIDFKNCNALSYIENMEEEIERLKEELKYTIPIVEHNKTITKHLKEIERLNNIISGIEQYIKYYVMNNFKFDNNTANIILYQLEKLKEEKNGKI